MVQKYKKILDTLGKDMDFHFLEEMQQFQLRENYMIEFKGNYYLHPQNKERFQIHLWDLSKKIASFANTEGGFIFFGISEKKHEIRDLEGCDHDVIDSIKRVLSYLQPIPQVEIYPSIPKPTEENRFFYTLEVFKSNRPTMIYTKDHPRKGTFPIRIDEETFVADLKHVEMLFKTLKEDEKREKLVRAFVETLQLSFSTSNIHVRLSIYERLKIIARTMKGAPFISFFHDHIYILDKYIISIDRIIDVSQEPRCDSKKNPLVLSQFSIEFQDYIKERYNIYLDCIFP